MRDIDMIELVQQKKKERVAELKKIYNMYYPY